VALMAWRLGFFYVPLCASAAESPAPPLPVNAAVSTKPGVAFLTAKTRLWLGQNQVLCFKATNLEKDHVFSFQADPGFLQVLMPPAILPGQSIGYLRVQPQREGQTEITLDGASLKVQIVREAAANTLRQTRPEITSPAQGSAVWGNFVVGVEQLNLANTPNPIPPVLRLSGGREIAAQKVPSDFPGPHLRYVFNVDAQSLPAGMNSLVAVTKEPSGEELGGEPVDILVARPDATSILVGDCKDQAATPPPLPEKPPLVPPRPYRPQPLVADAQSGTGSVILNQIYIAVNVPKDGVYGLMMEVRGGVGCDALPSMGFQVDNVRDTARACRLATTGWQRVPVGDPINLTAGPHTLSVRLQNGFSTNAQDNRSLYLATYELAPLDQAASTLAANSPGSAMMMQGAAPMQAMQPAAAGGPGNPSEGSFHVLFSNPIQGKVIADEVHVAIRTDWSRHDNPLPPKVDLLVNDHVVGSIRHANPEFHVAVSAFRPGGNTVQAVGRLADGQRAETSVQTIYLPDNSDPGREPVRPNYIFFADDPGWDATMHSHRNLKDENSPATFYSNGEASLALPDEVEGLYKISIAARGINFMGFPSATILLQANGQETKLGEIATTGRPAVCPVTQAILPAGPKSLVLRFDNDNFVQGKGIRTLVVNSIQLDPAATDPIVTLPTAKIVYPPDGTKVGFADAVVANLFARNGIDHADLLVDGQPQHLDLKPPNGLGPLLFPLLTRILTPGPHRVQVEVDDQAGGTGRSQEVSVNVSGQAEVADGPYHRAVFLLNRFGYGPETAELADLLARGPRDWLAEKLSDTSASPGEQNEMDTLRLDNPNPNSVVPRVLEQLVTDPDPVRMRFLMWTENHFSTWMQKEGAPAKTRENDRFVSLGVASFPTLLLASATSPAMLLYLDQRNSVTKHLNENYAREIMELHTLGVKGGYTQTDVTTLADLLTGWTVTDESNLDGTSGMEHTFRYDPYLNSGTACEVLGMEFPAAAPEQRFDRVLTALEMLGAHPSCARFISRKLAEHYVSDPAPPEVVDHLSLVYLETGGDMQSVLLALLDEPAFWTADPKVATPLDYGVRMQRMSGVRSPGALNEMMSRSGMGLFDRFSPDGYPEADGYYSNSNGLLQRWHFAQVVQNSFLNNGLIPTGWRPNDAQWDAASTQRVIDLAAQKITGDVLSDSTNSAATELLASAPPNTETRIRLLALFLCQSPETNLR
jgi:uncharacterized protein (DUF1800 family)